MGEWFMVVQGKGDLDICDPKSKQKVSIPLDSAVAQTVYVPAGIAHSITNTNDELLICVAWAEKEYDPEDVYHFSL
jgi:oxalate decarboxylase/phosphoglucose isomerase-like protein (cupin superfamily)